MTDEPYFRVMLAVDVGELVTYPVSVGPWDNAPEAWKYAEDARGRKVCDLFIENPQMVDEEDVERHTLSWDARPVTTAWFERLTPVHGLTYQARIY